MLPLVRDRDVGIKPEYQNIVKESVSLPKTAQRRWPRDHKHINAERNGSDTQRFTWRLGYESDIWGTVIEQSVFLNAMMLLRGRCFWIIKNNW